MSQHFSSGGQSTTASASVLPMNSKVESLQDWPVQSSGASQAPISLFGALSLTLHPHMPVPLSGLWGGPRTSQRPSRGHKSWWQRRRMVSGVLRESKTDWSAKKTKIYNENCYEKIS